jgi:hypothetical protein
MPGNTVGQDITVYHMQKIVNAGPTAGEGNPAGQASAHGH